jgi:hypothetical protein
MDLWGKLYRLRFAVSLMIIFVSLSFSCERKNSVSSSGTSGGISNGVAPTGKDSVAMKVQPADKTSVAGSATESDTGTQGEVKGSSAGTNSGSAAGNRPDSVKANESSNPVRSNSGPVNQDSIDVTNQDRDDREKVSGEGEWIRTKKDTIKKN